MTGFIGLLSLIAIIYYAVKLFKKRKIATLKKRYRIGLIISAVIFIFAVGIDSGHKKTEKQADSSNTTKVVKKTEYVGKEKYNIAKKENVALIAKKKKLVKQEDKLQEQKDQITVDAAAAQQKAKDDQAAAQKQQEEQAKAAKKQQEQAQQTQAQSSQATSQTTSQTKGDMNTGDTGTVVGNSQSHIYHVPGQRGYNMNSSNAVYFNNEQDAINAGYRRSKV
ncbi:hypothetical protein [Companilactobacillus kimchiensis]|uniref:DNA-entry nuclease n=1 Tax=Companilactobacillus kimchiensis TaxID=993692 RepID=A0A0R2LM58_9LACO|nr:hypothetical protein [Companilactobacillus kimchiensis]KRO00061.1 hypothetical protein IV57_GL002077 [Companilactobacillus kimchiensis]